MTNRQFYSGIRCGKFWGFLDSLPIGSRVFYATPNVDRPIIIKKISDDRFGLTTYFDQQTYTITVEESSEMPTDEEFKELLKRIKKTGQL